MLKPHLVRFREIKLLMVLAALLSPTLLLADDHSESAPGVIEIYECDLINGATVDDVLKFGRGNFTEFAKEVGNDVMSFLWTPVAIAPPFQETSLRWVNHYPSWAEYDKGNAAWMANEANKLRNKLFSLVSCDLPVFHQRHGVVRTQVERPARLLIGRCDLNPGKDMTDVKRHLTPARSEAIAQAIGVTRGHMLTTPRLGVDANLDFLNIFFASRTEMAKMQDAGRKGEIQAAYRQITNGATAPYTCPVWDLHDSHYMFDSQ